MINDKVEELVEWVAGEVASELLKFAHDYHRFEEFRRKVIVEGVINLPYPKKIAKQILSHPDLALMVECELCKGEGYLPNDDTGEPNPPVGGIRCPVCHETGMVPIPLAEALKEVKDDRHSNTD